VLVDDAALDPDGDAVSNVGELGQLTLPCDPDTDDDGFKDLPYTAHEPTNTDPNRDNCIIDANPGQENNDADLVDLPPSIAIDDTTYPFSDGLGDACDPDDDNDGLTDTSELATPCASASGPTNPLSRDTDGDYVMDGYECLLGTNPANAGSKPGAASPDSDGDGVANGVEAFFGSNPNSSQSDADGISDGIEIRFYASNPVLADTDADGCNDNIEITSVNNDRKTSSIDLSLVSQHFGLGTDPLYLREFDINKDGRISAIDLSMVSANLGMC
jgi:hypothetical protein